MKKQIKKKLIIARPKQKAVTASKKKSEYEKDFYKWSFHQAALLRTQEYAKADFVHLIKEIEALGKELKHAIKSSKVI